MWYDIGGATKKRTPRKRLAADTVPGVHVISVNVVEAKSHCSELCLVEDPEHRHHRDLQTPPAS